MLGGSIPASLELALLARVRWEGCLGKVRRVSPGEGLRELISHLDAGGSCAITVDHFGGRGSRGAQCTFLGREVRVSTGAARLAARLGIPLVPVTLEWTAGVLQVRVGSPIPAAPGPEGAMRRVLKALSAGIRQDPASWRLAHRFVRSG
jgi:lauroyl/myristoyl acyltransferase